MTTELAVYRELGREPTTALAFVKDVGASLRGGLKGCSTPGQSTAAALQMLTEGLSPAQFEAKYHVYDGGGFGLHAEWVLAEMERQGYSPTWLEDGEDGQRATLQITKNGVPHKMSFSIEQAKSKKLVKDKSQWANDPAVMLRARAITRTAKAYCPSILVGPVADDFDEESVVPAARKPRATKLETSQPGEQAAAKPADEAEFVAASTDNPPAEATEGGELISDAEVEEIRRIAASEQRLYQTAKFVIEKIFEVQVPIQELSAMQGKWLLIYLYFDLLKIDGPTQSKGLANMGVSEVFQLDKAKANAMLAALRKKHAAATA